MTDILDKLLGWDKLTPWNPEKKIIPASGVDPDLIYGVELEIEGLDEEEEDRRKRTVPGMEYHEDGSLRNYGGEFVTAPMKFGVLEYVLNQFFLKNKLTEENYSERCSVHVHVNCRDLTLSQIRLILCLYQIMERILFNFIKADRKNNIFCVPWSESVLGNKALQSELALWMMIRGNRWQKYSALNLLPLRTQGTIEFRHMEGTNDLGYILMWCNIIGSIFKYARNNKYDDVINDLMGLNTTSAYATFMQNIFDGEIYEALVKQDFREHLEEGVLNMKFMLAADEKAVATKETIHVEQWPALEDDDIVEERVQFGPAAAERIALAPVPRNQWRPNNPHVSQLLAYENMGILPEPATEQARQNLINSTLDEVYRWEHEQNNQIFQAPQQNANIGFNAPALNNFNWGGRAAGWPVAGGPQRPIPRRINRR